MSDQARVLAAQPEDLQREIAYAIELQVGESPCWTNFMVAAHWILPIIERERSSTAQACYEKAAQEIRRVYDERDKKKRHPLARYVSWMEQAVLALAGSPAPAMERHDRFKLEVISHESNGYPCGDEEPHNPDSCIRCQVENAVAGQVERQITEGLRTIHDETRCNEWLGPFQCWGAQGHSEQCKFDPKREVSSKELLEMVIGSIEGYPHHGGDIGVMNAVKKLVGQREAEIRADTLHDFYIFIGRYNGEPMGRVAVQRIIAEYQAELSKEAGRT